MQLAATVLYVDDVRATVDFYCRAFGMTVRFSDDALGFTELEANGIVLAIASHSIGEMLMPGNYPKSSPKGVELGFLTTDVPAAFQKLIDAGAIPLAAPKRMPWGLEVAYLSAPEGTLIGLSEPPPPPKK